MNDLPRLTESKIQQWIGDASFQRGERYYRQGRIFNPRRQSETLKALFHVYRWDVDSGGYGIGDDVPDQVGL